MVDARLPPKSDHFFLACLLQQEFNLGKLKKVIFSWSQQMCIMQYGGGIQLPYVLLLQDILCFLNVDFHDSCIFFVHNYGMNTFLRAGNNINNISAL